MLKRMIDELMDHTCVSKLDVDALRGKLKAIKTRIGEALSINVSSEKLMTFLLEDTMDLAALRMKKFKRNDSVFAVKELFDEVISVLAFKAEHKLIKVSVDYDGFDKGERKVCCDKRRIM
jgi:signal transduction histidine kinase